MVHEQGISGNHRPHQLSRYGNGAGGAATGVARASKKNKNSKKTPQRGLGVAQLEKLRIEEQKKMEGGSAMSSVPGAAHALGGGGLAHLLPMHPPPPPPLADGGVHCGYSPVLWDPADPMKIPYKRGLCPQPPLPAVSTGLSLTASSNHPTEPPSNQMYSSSSSASRSCAPAPADEDREEAGVERSWPFMFEGMNTTAFRTPSAKAPFAARTARETGLPDVCPDLSRYEFRATNYFSSNANYSDWSSEFTHCKSSKENNGCTGEPAYLTMNAHPAPRMKQPRAIPSIHLPEFSDLDVLQCQGQQGSVSAAALSSSRPFYSFMPVGPVRCERPLGEIMADVSDGVDLELKL